LHAQKSTNICEKEVFLYYQIPLPGGRRLIKIVVNIFLSGKKAGMKIALCFCK
jgi:hypothetical protein